MVRAYKHEEYLQGGEQSFVVAEETAAAEAAATTAAALPAAPSSSDYRGNEVAQQGFGRPADGHKFGLHPSPSGDLNYLSALAQGSFSDDCKHSGPQQQQQQSSKREESSHPSDDAANQPEKTKTSMDGSNTNVGDPGHQQQQPQLQQERRQDLPRSRPIPKYIRVGQKVSFSTVVSAVLIPSHEDISSALKRELWWQPEDFFQFRMNHIRRQAAGRTAVDEEDEEQDLVVPHAGYQAQAQITGTDAQETQLATTTPTTATCEASANTEDNAVAAAVAFNDGGSFPASSGATATVEGVLVVAAAPAPASPSPVPGTVASNSRGHRVGVSTESLFGDPYAQKSAIATSDQQRTEKNALRSGDAHVKFGARKAEQQWFRRPENNGCRSAHSAGNHGGNRNGRGWRQTSPGGAPGRVPVAHTARFAEGSRPTVHSYARHSFNVSMTAAPGGRGVGVGGNGCVSSCGMTAAPCARRATYDNGAVDSMVAQVFQPSSHMQHHYPPAQAPRAVISAPHHASPAMMAMQQRDAAQFSLWRSQLMFAPIMMQ